ncbi:MAG: HAMP domain-containing histidine kinase [Chloroflexi bacterium]|nr:HAMP domain-containing histidine kinase [Chloroflexota bacterium]
MRTSHTATDTCSAAVDMVKSVTSDLNNQQHAPALMALLLVDDGVTADELARRLAALSEIGRPDRAASLLEHLARLGLVAVASAEGAQARFVLTALGQRYASETPGCQPDVTAQLQELERLRTDLLSTIAHELRTPLTAIRTCIGLLRDPTVEPDPEAHAKLLRTIEQSADRMQRLVTDVLDLTRFRSGGIRLQLRRFDAGELAREAAAAIAPLLAGRGQQLVLTLPGSPTWLYGDHRRLERALLNLLSNALKFSPDGGEVRLSLVTTGKSVGWSVTDQGAGIADEDRPRLFERFFTAATDGSGAGAGTGLGLPIARAIALAHGGEIDVESDLGRGSTFTLRVPAAGPIGSGAS